MLKVEIEATFTGELHPIERPQYSLESLVGTSKTKGAARWTGALTEEQSDALNLAMYVGMSLEEDHMFAERTQRINRLSDLVIANLRNL